MMMIQFCKSFTFGLRLLNMIYVHIIMLQCLIIYPSYMHVSHNYSNLGIAIFVDALLLAAHSYVTYNIMHLLAFGACTLP